MGVGDEGGGDVGVGGFDVIDEALHRGQVRVALVGVGCAKGDDLFVAGHELLEVADVEDEPVDLGGGDVGEEFEAVERQRFDGVDAPADVDDGGEGQRHHRRHQQKHGELQSDGQE